MWRRLPFSAETWRETLFVVAAAPATLVTLVDDGRLQERLIERLLATRAVPTRGRALVLLPVAAAAGFVCVYGWLIVVLNLAYPLRWLIGMGGSLADSWGGPTMAGAWAFHALVGGVPFLFLMPWIVRGLARLELWIVRR